MSRTTIMADDGLLNRLRAIARTEGKSLAAVIREALETRARPVQPTWIGAIDSGHTDTSERVDELIAEWIGKKHAP